MFQQNVGQVRMKELSSRELSSQGSLELECSPLFPTARCEVRVGLQPSAVQELSGQEHLLQECLSILLCMAAELAFVALGDAAS